MLIVAGYLVNLGIISRINKNIIAPSETNSDWKMYENAEYNVRFKYPQELSIKEDTDIAPNSWKIFLYEEGGTPHTLFSVQTKLKDEEVDDSTSAKPEDVKTFNGRSWGYFNYPPGNTKGSIYTAYQYINNDTRYTFLFYTKMNSEIRDQIMETLEISF